MWTCASCTRTCPPTSRSTVTPPRCSARWPTAWPMPGATRRGTPRAVSRPRARAAPGMTFWAAAHPAGTDRSAPRGCGRRPRRRPCRWAPPGGRCRRCCATACPRTRSSRATAPQVSYFGTVPFWPMDAPRRFVYPTGYATLGYAVPAAIGAKLAAQDRTVIALAVTGARCSACRSWPWPPSCG
ncbi:thiamine pyrophosphate-dependent enzyme [Nonomuraea dietziae]|uniref:thiamine pyrophosphate-dependent enzyme n=1 Tax=Nonomuraea dietziae TaxID=65515 RepID=UPI003CD0C17E